MKRSTQLTRTTLARLRKQLHDRGIQQKTVAAEAGVSKHMVSHVLAGRAVSANVVATAKRLIADAKAKACAA
ncbi:MAG: hypothetical protein FJ253_12205 [Phycisphaerae bacterium]|nr:hypothetical protein [Phycisphaerae bacterium]